jgi:glycosyltransferase involved in cell wall biosynthesis
LKILFLIFRDFKNPEAAGGDFYLWELARGLSNLGNRVTIVCSSFYGCKSRELIDGVEVIRTRGSWSLSLRILRTYFRELKGKYDVAVEEAIGGQRLPFLCSMYIKEPLVAVWHQKHDKIFREQYPFPITVALSYFERFLARLYRNCTILTPSKGAKEKLMQLGFKRENIKVVYDGAGEIFHNASPSGEREDLIVCLGKLRRYKRADHAILALERVVHLANKPCRLIIAGKVSEIDKGYVDWLHSQAERLKVADHIEIKVNISEKEKLKLLEKAKVLVQPSPVEGFSIVVAEANRCGTPVVVSDGVPSDVVVNGHNGLVYPYGHIEHLATSIVKLIEDDALWNRMSRNAYNWSQQFNWENSAREFQRILQLLIAPQQPLRCELEEKKSHTTNA